MSTTEVMSPEEVVDTILDRLEIVREDEVVETILGYPDRFKPYYGQKATDADSASTKVRTAKLPLNIILGLHHMVQIGGCNNGDTLDLVNHMTPGLNFYMGYSSPLPKYAQDVCMPEIRKQHPDILAVELPADGNLYAFYDAMVERFGKTIDVKSIAQEVA